MPDDTGRIVVDVFDARRAERQLAARAALGQPAALALQLGYVYRVGDVVIDKVTGAVGTVRDAYATNY